MNIYFLYSVLCRSGVRPASCSTLSCRFHIATKHHCAYCSQCIARHPVRRSKPLPRSRGLLRPAHRITCSGYNSGHIGTLRDATEKPALWRGITTHAAGLYQFLCQSLCHTSPNIITAIAFIALSFFSCDHLTE